MLHIPAEFPHPGSRAFVRGTADPVTIIRRNADGTAFVRLDPRPLERRNRDASGNTTMPNAHLFSTAEEASLQNTPRPSRRARRSNRAPRK